MKVTKFIPNKCDANHCLQAAFRMVFITFLSEDPDPGLVDEWTGYVPKRGTWQFRAMLSFAEHGLHVIDHEEFDTEEFVSDPELSIRKQVGDDEIAARNIADTDLVGEVAALRACLAHPNIEFRRGVPSIKDMRDQLAQGRLLICNVNSKKLGGLPGFQGHFVVVQNVSSTSIVLQDPGPPPRPDCQVSPQVFTSAWMDPLPDMANYVAVGPPFH